MTTKDERFWELKQAAKWASSVDERKKAVGDLSRNYGQDAIQALSEIRDVTVYEEIKQLCIDAIRSVSNNGGGAPATHATSATADKGGSKKKKTKTKRPGLGMRRQSGQRFLKKRNTGSTG